MGWKKDKVLAVVDAADGNESREYCATTYESARHYFGLQICTESIILQCRYAVSSWEQFDSSSYEFSHQFGGSSNASNEIQSPQGWLGLDVGPLRNRPGWIVTPFGPAVGSSGIFSKAPSPNGAMEGAEPS